MKAALAGSSRATIGARDHRPTVGQRLYRDDAEDFLAADKQLVHRATVLVDDLVEPKAEELGPWGVPAHTLRVLALRGLLRRVMLTARR